VVLSARFVRPRGVALLTLIVMLASSSALAQGGPPMFTDDPGTPGPGVWEVNLALVHREGDGVRESELPLVDINFGVGERVQLKAEVAWNWTDDRLTRSRSGLGDYSLGVKARFADDFHGWRISTYPQIGFEKSDDERAKNLLVPVEFQREFATWDVDVEVGHQFLEHGPDEWVAGIAVGRKLAHSLECAAELHGTGDGSAADSGFVANLGMRITRWKSGVLLLSIGRELRSPEGEGLAWLGYAGWQLSF
jgi:hypothetical protein